PTYTAHVDSGDFVVVTNCRQLKVSGKKLEQTTYDTYSGYPGGLRQTPREKIFKEKPEFLLTLAVKRMLPKSPLGRHMLSKLKAYADSDHPHQAQQPKPLEV
ncbi:MAG: 50S ribosomal protein L13, partial [Planctomycetes bacterium]|nr:50S ribosomal protein L13 [Planctomycetota bacterium]